jgi:hypothetical protein
LRFKASLDWWSGGEAKVVGPEFKPQYRKKKKREKERKKNERNGQAIQGQENSQPTEKEGMAAREWWGILKALLFRV